MTMVILLRINICSPDIILKPFQIKEVVSTVEYALGGKADALAKPRPLLGQVTKGLSGI
jgi:hypothetical protein